MVASSQYFDDIHQLFKLTPTILWNASMTRLGCLSTNMYKKHWTDVSLEHILSIQHHQYYTKNSHWQKKMQRAMQRICSELRAFPRCDVFEM